MTANKKSAKNPIQRVELNTFYWISIHCPFCGQKVVDYDDPDDAHIKPCEHTLFVASDEGFEYRADRFNKNLGIEDMEEVDLLDHYFDEDVAGYDGLTDKVDMPDAIKFAAYVGPPCGLGSYCGFAPVDEDE